MTVTGLGQCSLDYLALVDSYPESDTKKEVIELNQQGGGPVATALVTLSRLGIDCRFHGITGDDEEAAEIVESLEAECIDVRGLIQRPGQTSQIAFIVIEQRTARRTIFWKRPSGKALQAEELGERFLVGSQFLLLDGLMEDASLFAAHKARELKIPVMLDAGRVRPGMLEIARLSDYLVASEEFARDLEWGLSGDTLQRAREKLGVKILTITRGIEGSITVSEEGAIHMPGFTVEAIDTTGAGDVFHGGYIYGILHGWHLRDIIVFASATAAIKCMKLGGRAGIPRIGEVRTFLKKKGYHIAGLNR